ncbi:site-specific integrase [Aerococcaceae bacterium NML160702]|nr:site-specific integrase [Aerococcaceae bacterium NML160702]
MKINFQKEKIRIKQTNSRPKIADEFELILLEMRALGRRERTIFDYQYHFNKMVELNNLTYIDELTQVCLLNYLSQDNISSATKRIRLKAIRPILKRLYQKQLLQFDWWSELKISVDEEIKQGVTEQEMDVLLNSLDYSDYVEFRDATIFLTLFETGIRIQTLQSMTIDMIDFSNQCIHFRGSTMKNHKSLTLPVSETLIDMYKTLIEACTAMLEANQSKSLFLTLEGNTLTGKAFAKRVAKYKKDFKLKHINPHAIRRGFAKRLLDKGVNIAIISKALNHSSLEVTTKYLYVSNDEVVEALRDIF